MHCEHCGQVITQPARFCPECGCAVRAVQPVITQARPLAGGQIGFSIVNIVFGCVTYGVSILLGLIALIFAVVASSAYDPSDAAKKLKVSKTINIIAVVLIGCAIIGMVLMFILQIAFFSAPVFFGDNYYTY